MLISVKWRKGEVRQIACDIQYLDVLKMHVHGRIMFSFYSFVFFFSPNNLIFTFLCVFFPPHYYGPLT